MLVPQLLHQSLKKNYYINATLKYKILGYETIHNTYKDFKDILKSILCKGDYEPNHSCYGFCHVLLA